MYQSYWILLLLSLPTYPAASYLLSNLPRRCRPAIAQAQRIIKNEIARLARTHEVDQVQAFDYPPHISFARVVQDASEIKPELLRQELKRVCAGQSAIDVTRPFHNGRFELWPGRFRDRKEVRSYFNCVWRLGGCEQMAVLASRFEELVKQAYGTDQPKEFVPHCTVLKIYCDSLPPSFMKMLDYLSERFPGDPCGKIVLDHVKVTAVDECMHVSFDD